MKTIQKAYFQLHIAIFLYGFTAILGKLITLSELSLVWWRMLLTTISFLFFPKMLELFKAIPVKIRWQLFGIGVVIALHWVCFFGGIKYSNVSICLVCMATGAFFTAILEPLIFKQKIKKYELILGAMIIPGMYLVVQSTSWDMMTGIVLALISSILAVLFTVLNKRMIDNTDNMDTSVITFIELGSGWLFLTVLLPFYLYFFETSIQPTWLDLGYLLILALFCTTLAFVLNLNALKHISAFNANLAINLEPVYGIVLAWLIFQENKEVGSYFYIGVLIVLLAVFSYPYLKKRFEE
jgi:drug/metabolite transporter (DMT)-like permease